MLLTNRTTSSIALASLLSLALGSASALSADDSQPTTEEQTPSATAATADFAAGTAPAGSKGTDASSPEKAATDKDKSILDLDIDQLGKVQAKVPTAFDTEVTTVTANKSSIGQSPAAVFVITSEMIRRSGATEVPECLRMCPGLDVAKVGLSSWAISSRGFNSQYATRLLVLVDGRSVYNTLFGGVYWDTQDLVLQDVDRIEVIRGPGATIWGANAVDGVINIITKSSAQTQGLQVVTGGGNQNKTNSTIRYGGQVGDNTFYRLWVKEQDNAAGFNPQQGSANDAWGQLRGGFRLDSQNPDKTDTVTLQGDIYTGFEGFDGPVSHAAPPFVTVTNDLQRVCGGDVLGRWTHVVDENNTYFVQTYFDRLERSEPFFFDIAINTWDIMFQQNLKHGNNHVFTWGAGYRLYSDNYPTTNGLPTLDPQSSTYDQANIFFQEEMPLWRDDLRFYFGSKFMYYFFTGFEYQPTARLLWTINDKQVLWGAVSRAVRTPVRIEENADFLFPASQSPPVFLDLDGGGRSLQSEDLLAFELGYRRQVNDRLSFEMATFYNIYHNLIAANVVEFIPGVPPVELAPYRNAQDAQTTGVELNWNWKVLDNWKIQGWYSFLYMQVGGNGGSSVPGNSPQNQAYLMSSWDLPFKMEFDLMPRFVQSLPAQGVPFYTTMDARLGWRPNDHWEFSIVGQNLLQAHHLEFVSQTTIVSEVNRGVYGQAIWCF
jgi:iron complex outermembrane recepter protein